MGRFSMLSLLLAALVLLGITEIEASNLKWERHFNGFVPKYAVAGGEDVSGEVLYVARIHLSAGFTPGKMKEFDKAYATWKGKVLYKYDYEILTNPGWSSQLEWKKSSGSIPPANAVVGGTDNGRTVYVGRVMHSDGHMTPGKVLYFDQKAYVGYGGYEHESNDFWVLVEQGGSGRKRGFSRFEYPDLPGATPLKRAPILDQ